MSSLSGALGPAGGAGSGVASRPSGFFIAPIGGIPWHRISCVLLLLSIMQCFMSIYIFYAYESHRILFLWFLCYALVSVLAMAGRSKFGLVWFGGGSLVALVWTCVLVYDSISRKEWVRVCFDFSLCAFECLVACLAFSRFHDLGGFTICCGPPSRDWKGSLLVGGGIDDLRAAAMRGYGDDEETEAEPERFLNQTLLAQTTNSAHHYLAQNSYSRAPPQLQQLQQQQQQQQAYFPARGAVAPHASFAESHHSHAESESHLSDVSSASSSYRHTVGEGVLYGASHRSDSSAYESGVPHGTA